MLPGFARAPLAGHGAAWWRDDISVALGSRRCLHRILGALGEIRYRYRTLGGPGGGTSGAPAGRRAAVAAT